MPWIPLDSQAAVERLMDRFGAFHDACLREASLVTDTFIDADGTCTTTAASTRPW